MMMTQSGLCCKQRRINLINMITVQLPQVYTSHTNAENGRLSSSSTAGIRLILLLAGFGNFPTAIGLVPFGLSTKQWAQRPWRLRWVCSLTGIYRKQFNTISVVPQSPGEAAKCSNPFRCSCGFNVFHTSLKAFLKLAKNSCSCSHCSKRFYM